MLQIMGLIINRKTHKARFVLLSRQTVSPKFRRSSRNHQFWAVDTLQCCMYLSVHRYLYVHFHLIVYIRTGFDCDKEKSSHSHLSGHMYLPVHTHLSLKHRYDLVAVDTSVRSPSESIWTTAESRRRIISADSENISFCQQTTTRSQSCDYPVTRTVSRFSLTDSKQRNGSIH